MNPFKNKTQHICETCLRRRTGKERIFNIGIPPLCCIVLLFLACIPGCASGPRTDPLAGWFGRSLTAVPPQITKDYQEYISELPTEQRELVGPIFFYEDNAGHFAIQFQIPLDGTWKAHMLIYDSAYRRIKVVRYSAGHYMS
jgi:hypothetical protein